MSLLNRLGRGWDFPVRPDPRAGALAYTGGPEKVRQSIGIILDTEPGERIMRRPIDAHDQETPATCRDIAARALRCAGRDVLAIVSFGEQFANWHWQWLASRSSRVGQA